jgi:hypothetical protein
LNMYSTQSVLGPARMRMPRAHDVRQRLAEEAAGIVGKHVDAVLELLGPIEAAATSLSENESAWRLGSYHGTPTENDAIERAITRVQRALPFVDLRRD